MDKIKFVKASADIDKDHKIKELINQYVGDQAFIWLSGGSSPRELYKNLANDPGFKPAGAALVDERFGPKGHKDSNEAIIESTGLLESLRQKDIPFHPILWNQALGNWQMPELENTAANYNLVVEKLVNSHQKHFLVAGIGPDGHTAGIFPDMPNTDQYVIGYETSMHMHKHRITITPRTLEELSLKETIFIILLFGADKTDIVKMLQKDEGHGGLPASIYRQMLGNGSQVFVFTDQI